MVKQKNIYNLLCQFKSLVSQITNINNTISNLGNVRYKPLYSIYNSYIDTFEDYYPHQYKQLNIEPLPLYNANKTELFTNEKLSTLLHQSEFIVAFLKGSLPPNYSGTPENFKESLGWYWNNTHWSIPIFFGGLLFSFFITGTIFSETTLYKKTVKPFIIEYITFKNAKQNTITKHEPPKQNTPKK